MEQKQKKKYHSPKFLQAWRGWIHMVNHCFSCPELWEYIIVYSSKLYIDSKIFEIHIL